MFDPSHLFQSSQEENYRNKYPDFRLGKHPQHRIATLVPPTKPKHASRQSWNKWQRLIAIWQTFSRRQAQRSQLSIQKITNANRESWWHVTDPRTHKSFYAQTLNEAIDWIEAQRLGNNPL